MKRILLMVLSIISIYVAPVGASEAGITLDAGWIEWADGYIRASDGFQLKYEGKNMTGSELVYNTVTGEYELNQAGFWVCKKEHPHYMIYAKQVEIYPGERIIFTGAKVQLGSQTIPVPFKLVLTYQDGEYAFPDWLPELFYNQKGLGIRISNVFVPTQKITLGSVLEASTLGGVDVKLWSHIGVAQTLSVDGEVANDGNWLGSIKVKWRENLQGWQGFADVTFDGQGFKKQAALDYNYSGWRLGVLYNEANDSARTKLELSSPQMVFGGILQRFSTGVRRVTDVEIGESYNEYYIANFARDQHKIGKVLVDWSWDMKHLFIEDQGWKGQALGQTVLTLPVTNKWRLGLGYERSLEWGKDMAYSFDSYKPQENTEFQITYSGRNDLSEGWDLSIKAKYNLLDERFAQAGVGIVRAFDCFDVVLDLDLVTKSLESKVVLKF